MTFYTEKKYKRNGTIKKKQKIKSRKRYKRKKMKSRKRYKRKGRGRGWKSRRRGKKTQVRYVTSCSEECRDLIVSQPKKLLAFYSNPIIINTCLQPLNSLTREMHEVTSLLNPYDYSIIPATTSGILDDSLKNHDPKIILWSGHILKDSVIIEKENGTIYFLDPKEFFNKLKKLENLKLVVFLTCNSHAIIPPRTDPIHKKCSFISWKTKVEDNAAYSFLSGIISEINNQFINMDSNINITDIFENGRKLFETANFSFGDPDLYLGNHNGHNLRFINKECTGCIPPVQGIVCLTQSEDLVSTITNKSNNSKEYEITLNETERPYTLVVPVEEECSLVDLQETTGRKLASEVPPASGVQEMVVKIKQS
jgi:hypothetical protein